MIAKPLEATTLRLHRDNLINIGYELRKRMFKLELQLDLMEEIVLSRKCHFRLSNLKRIIDKLASFPLHCFQISKDQHEKILCHLRQIGGRQTDKPTCEVHTWRDNVTGTTISMVSKEYPSVKQTDNTTKNCIQLTTFAKMFIYPTVKSRRNCHFQTILTFSNTERDLVCRVKSYFLLERELLQSFYYNIITLTIRMRKLSIPLYCISLLISIEMRSSKVEHKFHIT